jgi:hypothetical protein
MMILMKIVQYIEWRKWGERGLWLNWGFEKWPGPWVRNWLSHRAEDGSWHCYGGKK